MVLKYVYFPGNQTGYKYDYSPGWGMIFKVSNLRGMTVDSMSLTATGSVTNGEQAEVAASTTYNYPLTLGSPLTDVPAYTTRTDDWLGRTTAQAPVTSFSVNKNTGFSRTETRITAPDGTITESWAKIAPQSWDDGLVTDVFAKTLGGPFENVWSHTKTFWGNQATAPGRKNIRINKVETTNDANQTRAISFEYDNYNNQTEITEHDFAAPNSLGTELRRTEIGYETGSSWLNNRLVNLPKSIKTFVNSTIVSRTDYEYDGEQLLQYGPTPITQHDPTYNPGVPDGEYCYWVCPSQCQNLTEPEVCQCPLEQQCDPIPVFNPATNYRGNVTKVTAFSDATLGTDPNAVISTMKYDVVGNKVETSSSCCELRTTQYSVSSHYTFPVSVTSSGGGLQFTKSAEYDVDTSLLKTATDENNQTTTLTYNPANLALIRTDNANGAWAETEYNDSVFPYHVKTTSSLDATRSVSSWTFENGNQQVFRRRSLAAGGYLSKEIEYDIMGRAEKSFNPYTVANLTDARPAGIKFTVTTQRDGLGRPLSVSLPDLTIVSATYQGLVRTATDQAGKSRRQISDALGKIVRVDEPDVTGNLGSVTAPLQPTHYEYNGNSNLTKVTQSDGAVIQERLFKYDSLSRLTHERQIEANATLNNDGIKVASGGLWTGVYKYNSESQLIEGVDARGVKTLFSYDGLNRIKTTSYIGETGYQTPTITYIYDEAETGFYNNGRLTKVRTAADVVYGTPETVQNYRYDKVGQIKKHTQSIGNQMYQLEYGYNLAGQLISEKYPSGKIVNMTVDNFGVIQTVADGQINYLNGITFDDRGQLSQMSFGNGTNEIFSQNDRFQMTSQSLVKGAEVLQKYDYSYGTVDLTSGNVDSTKNNGQLSRIEGWIGVNKQWSQRFGYDELGRLKESREYKQGDSGQLTYKQVFDFDRFGNLYRKAASNPTDGQQNPLAYSPIEDADINRLKNRFATSTSYDDAGNVISDNKFRIMNFGYDANGRMIRATKVNQPDAQTVYDGKGNRVAEKINGVWRYMIYDAFGKLVAEYGIVRKAREGSSTFIRTGREASER